MMDFIGALAGFGAILLVGWIILGARWPFLVAAAVLFVALVLTLAGQPRAHEAPSGWAYDGRCCNAYKPTTTGHTGDCAPIPDSAVRIVAGGFIVHLRPGDHPLVEEEFTQTLRYGDPMFEHADVGSDPSLTALQASPDGRWHACIVGGKIRCLYVVPGAV